MRKPRWGLVVLPTRELIDEIAPSRTLLETADLPPELLLQYIVEQWSSCEAESWRWFHPGQLSTHDLVMSYVHEDLLRSPEFLSMAKDDKEAVIKIIHAFAKSIFTNIIPLIENLELTKSQLETLNSDRLSVKRWLGKDIVLEVQF